jgi:RNA polymerase sigma-70 factor (ECF subfamily)
MVTNASINQLNSARARREQYVGIWLPEPLPEDGLSDPAAGVESYHALSIGLLVLLEKLTPQERAVFLLKEIFSYDHEEIAEILGKATDHCRQLLKRAKERLGKDSRRFKVDMRVHERILQKFLAAVQAGEMDDLIQLLKEDILLFADGGGTSFMLEEQRLTAFPKPIEGRDKVIRLLLNLVPKFQRAVPDFHQETTIVNGHPALITFSGNQPVSLVALDTDGEQIRNIFVQTNPDKLKHFKKHQ